MSGRDGLCAAVGPGGDVVRRSVALPFCLSGVFDDTTELDSRGHADLAEDVAQLGLDRFLADEELGRDLRVRLAVDDEVRQLELALRQRRDARRRPGAAAAVDRAAEVPQLAFHLGAPPHRLVGAERRSGARARS